MLKNHPKGLLVAFFANMGERFGFYTMMGILVYYLTAKYGMTGTEAGTIYSGFYGAIYGLALVGGIIADRTKNFKGTISVGLITMLAGYIFMSIPGLSLYFTIGALGVIALGNGLFKGNLQAVVGQLYDDPKYSHLRDSAFSIFYMGINIGALFAPTVAAKTINWFIGNQGFVRNDELPALIHKFQEGTLGDTSALQTIADNMMGKSVDLATFCTDYLSAYSTGFNYAFGVAGAMMIFSFIIYMIFKRMLPDVKVKTKESGEVVEMSAEETKQRFVALGLVFATVIFFWMAFHQNGLTLSFFARDYTITEVGPATFLVFNIWSLLTIVAAILSLRSIIVNRKDIKAQMISAGIFIASVIGIYMFYINNDAVNKFSPELFQHFNPTMIVFLTPIVVGYFAWLNKRGKEPTAPRKIGMGMIITAFAFGVMLIGSLNLAPFSVAEVDPNHARVGTEWLISTYFILTLAELFLSPMGLSFVSKVSPPKYQGIMQGAWLGATAVGNLLLGVGSWMYERFEIWQVWAVFIILCAIAASFIFSIMKKIEKFG
ncbi:peptide MFS transporter [Halosquirtibacter xylanolyticus]|uniref:peptide MFS transporter n=1 Tax=Halosquirtibacter xylanolyticus TaxID=3374599 RepID=UPI003749FE92|nr:peptide MFS transporter [Prolixibacteraceae bacterium]